MMRSPTLHSLVALVALTACEVLQGPPEGGLLTFEVREVDWDPPTPRIVLFVSNDETYPCLNYRIENELTVDNHSILVAMSGAVTPPTVCLTAIGPAQIRSPLPIADGTYTLEFVRGGVTDRYTLTVTVSAIHIATLDSHFTRPTALRFPRAA
ncbi:MAG: hypothetical protein ACM358_12745 [Gemmatimonadota bacterium]